jgi:uncharacterized protein
MNFSRLITVIWLLCAGVVGLSAAQPEDADRRAFDEAQAKASKGDAEAQLLLASFYSQGRGVDRDLAKAARWHRKAADQGLARAQFQLGLDYARGAGLKADQAESFKWFQKAAESGLAEAQLELGLVYASGNGVREWPVEAARWYRKAAEQGLAGAQYELGKCFFEGTGVTKDILEGIKWIRKSADQGYAPAEDKLGVCYMKGEGVAKDNVQAYVWLNLAAAQGEESGGYSKVNLSKVERLLTPAEVREAQRQAREFKPGEDPSVTPATAAAPSGTAANKSGFVNVKADDESCEIFVDGAFVGNAPARLPLIEGTHVIEVKKAGFKDYRRELRVVEGSDLTLRSVLEKQ